MNNANEIFEIHKKGKLVVNSKSKILNRNTLSKIYTPGVADICKVISEDKKKVFDYTIKNNTVAVVTDGSAVLGLGNIGPEAALPVMEGKCALFKEFAGVDAFPICLKTQKTSEIIQNIFNISPGFGGINLEDISAPRCFEIERKLIELLDIPVFHDDQHGTAVVVLAALINSLKLCKKIKENIKIFISGAGAAGLSIANLLLKYGIKNIIMCDKFGIIHKNRKKGMNEYLNEICKLTNLNNITGGIEEGIVDSDVFIGVSVGNILKPEHIKKMKSNPIIFAMANPTPEISVEQAKQAGAFIVGSGRSDFPNQINNVLCFPGLFKALLKYKIKIVNDEIKIKTALAIAEIIKEEELEPDYIIPDLFDKRIVKSIDKVLASYNIKR